MWSNNKTNFGNDKPIYNSFKYKTKYEKNFCFLKKLLFLSRSTFIKTFLNWIQRKILNQQFSIECTFTMHFAEDAGADVQLHFLYALHQVVFDWSHFSSWCLLHCLIIVGRLQYCCLVRHSAMQWIYYSDLVCSHQLPYSTDVWRGQVGFYLLPNEELCNQPHH